VVERRGSGPPPHQPPLTPGRTTRSSKVISRSCVRTPPCPDGSCFCPHRCQPRFALRHSPGDTARLGQQADPPADRPPGRLRHGRPRPAGAGFRVVVARQNRSGWSCQRCRGGACRLAWS
jgi:hypothetical protein